MVAAAMAATVAASGFTLATNAPVGAQGETCNGLPATIVGTSGDDRLVGTPQRDVIVGLEGRDIIFGREGNDVICAGPGNDVVKGGAGKDYIEGNQGNDKLVGGIGKDTIDGGSAKDKVFGGGGGDILAGGSKRDFVWGQNGNDTCDLDNLDRFAACELGDVRGVNGFGSITANLEIPREFALHRIGAGGSLQGGLSYFQWEGYGANSDGMFNVAVFDQQQNQVDGLGSTLPDFIARTVLQINQQSPTLTFQVSAAPTDYVEIAVLHPDLTTQGTSPIRAGVPWVYDVVTNGPTPIQFDIDPGATGNGGLWTYPASGAPELLVNTILDGSGATFNVTTSQDVKYVAAFVGGGHTITVG